MSAVLTPLDLRYLQGEKWWLQSQYRCVSDTLGLIVIEAGFITDFNSVPRLLTNILPREEYGEAALPHDYLYLHGGVNGKKISRGDADRVHREFVVWAGVRVCDAAGQVTRVGDTPRWKVDALYYGLRLFGWVTWWRYRRRDRPEVA
jgi:Protein of unknown function (DUF1353)